MSNFSLLQHIVNAMPPWAEIISQSDTLLEFVASPARASGRSTRQYHLVTEIKKNGEIEVREGKHPSLPAFCPQRHINADGSFCLGLSAGHAIPELTWFVSWWRKIEVFLTCQETAHETGWWPNSLQLSHGRAGVTEVEAERIAESLGLLDEYRSAVRDDRGIISEGLRKVRPHTSRLVNGRRPCICGRQRGRYKRTTKLRRECQKDGDACLVFFEKKRREEEAEFWKLFSSWKPCCRTMNECPLKDYTPQGQAD